MSQHRAVCDRCHNPYYRRNLTEAWTLRNPGHTKGWGKEILRVCTKCMSEKEAKRVVNIVGVSLSVIHPKRRAA